LYSSMAVQGSR